MSAKKHKHKRKVANHSHAKKNATSPSLIGRYPRFFLGSGILLVLVAVLLLTIGYVSDARVGLSMIALFFGVGLVIFSNSALPKNKKTVK